MNATESIENYLPWLEEITPKDRSTITSHLYLWGIFESRLLKLQNTFASINDLVENWSSQDQSDLDSLFKFFGYFKDRFSENSHFGVTNEFVFFLPTDIAIAEFVRKTFKTKDAETKDCVKVMLIMIHGIRKYLFSGLGRDQVYKFEDNEKLIEIANSLLIEAIALTTPKYALAH